MWLFKSKIPSLADSGMLRGFTDWHSHILPGVDDGFQNMSDSLEALRHFDSLGVETLWLTPHIMEDYPNSTEKLRERFSELSDKWDGNLQLRLASENMLDPLFEERLEAGDLLPIGPQADHLLVETSYFSAPMGFERMLENVKSKGFYPLLAHPERYTYMDEEDYRRLKEMGVKMQLNYVSLVGGYGETSRKKAVWLLNNGFIDVAGSDIHRLESNQKLIKEAPAKKEHLDAILSLTTEKNRL